ncbi:polysaccharide biosynthesis protein GumE [Xylella taiwanensis]|nr:polysaccharide biosynthesis protein GumE [Xylella taiwanensis]MCD8456344.1 polysaccharide biosynthesis protein GumE [Xylella taiwanensis]MCD8458752.1 polysaccharide biosynthesis protein GumE [Xylella taiwanensis]MCD8460888.1 polysaccharide biosynthesis protein GumE [Xylella taiwanensis]MCD8463053.1 polysaccharide biosynthesis protein GumE [Xylella taiwanensis]MCD8465395.1 polysaccharide biosynthesis protein GumE [Xylella taiwanensis]
MNGITWERLRNILIGIVLFAGVTYNFSLAVINAKIFVVRPVTTYVVELVIYVACFTLGLFALDRKRAALVMSGLGFLVALTLIRFLMSFDFDPKFFRDALIAFAFLVLGAAYRGSLIRLFMGMSIVVTLVACFELVVPDVYGDIANPKSYFINSRGASTEGFWNEESSLYVSATRPNERNFLPGSNLPRASSVFIEPVTMGNYIIFFAAIVLTFWRWMSFSELLLSVAMIGFMIVASDGRLATGTCMLMVLLAPLLRRFDQRFGFLLFFAVLVSSWLLVWISDIHEYNQDTILGRIFFSVYSLGHLPLDSWLGLDVQASYRYFDSGIAYFITSQSVITVLVFLLTYSFLFIMPSHEGRVFKNMAIFAFALSLFVSNSYFSIKTSALWWFTCGYLWHWSPQASGMRSALRPAVVTVPGGVS